MSYCIVHGSETKPIESDSSTKEKFKVEANKQIHTNKSICHYCGKPGHIRPFYYKYHHVRSLSLCQEAFLIRKD